MSKQNVQASGGRFLKTDVHYWQNAVFRPTYSRDGKSHETPELMAKIQHRGRRQTFPLDTPNRVVAASKAREIYQQIVGAGWDAALAKWKPAMHRTTVPTRTATVGEFLEAIKASSTLKAKTLEPMGEPSGMRAGLGAW